MCMHTGGHGTHTLTVSGAMPYASPRVPIFSWVEFFAHVVLLN